MTRNRFIIKNVLLGLTIVLFVSACVGLGLGIYKYVSHKMYIVKTSCNVSSCQVYLGICDCYACFYKTLQFNINDTVYNATSTTTSRIDPGACPNNNTLITCYYDMRDISKTLTLQEPDNDSQDNAIALMTICVFGILLLGYVIYLGGNSVWKDYNKRKQERPQISV